MAKNKYTLEDLKWLEETLRQLKGYVDNNPFDALEDRTEIVMSAKGTPVIKVIATKEAQIKTLISALKDYYTLLTDVDRLREEQAQEEIKVRGGGTLNGMMQHKFLINEPPSDEPDTES